MVAHTDLAQQWLVASACLSQQRREVCSRSLLLFADVYLGTHFKLDPSPMHKDIAKLLKGCTARRGRKIAIAAPRGHAKSTLVSLAYVLWSICYAKDPFIILLSSTAEQAQLLLQSVSDELLHNEMLRQDFPEVCERRGSRPRPPRWTLKEIVTASGVRIVALGAGMQIRGRKHGSERPTLVILDDVETDEGVRSEEQRRKLEEWFLRAVLPVGTDRTNFIVIGTLLHDDSLLAKLVDPKRHHAWQKQVYRAVTKMAECEDLWRNWERLFRGEMMLPDGRTGPQAALAYFKANRAEMLSGAGVLWPEREGYYSLMKQKMAMGKYAFAAEKQNDPVDPEESLMYGTNVVYWDTRHKDFQGLMRYLGPNAKLIAGCDPSMGSDAIKGDYSAIIVAAKDKRDSRLYVVESDIRRRRPDEIVMALMHYCQRYGFSKLYVEANGFQEMLVTHIERQAKLLQLPLSVSPVKNTHDKKARIQSLQPMLHNGLLQLCSTHRELLNQLERFPRAAHDDGPDALELVARKGFEREHTGGIY